MQNGLLTVMKIVKARRIGVHVGVDTDQRISQGVRPTLVGPHTHPPTTEIGLEAPMPTNNLSNTELQNWLPERNLV